MTPAEMLASLHLRGVILAPSPDGSLRYHPKEALSVAERADLARHRKEILVLLDADPTGWRKAVMLRQVPRKGTIPLLVARPGIMFVAGTCCSCGDPLAPTERYRCLACVEAAVAALREAG